MVMATIEDTERGLLTLRLNLLLLPTTDTDMARGLLMLRPVMDMGMDTDMVVMDMDTVMDMAMDMAMDMVMVIDTAKGLLMLRPATDMAMDMAMEVMAMDMAMAVMDMDMVMDTALDTAMDTDTMDKRTRQKKFHTENNTKSSVSIS